jgi:hypothetical protein
MSIRAPQLTDILLSNLVVSIGEHMTSFGLPTVAIILVSSGTSIFALTVTSPSTNYMTRATIVYLTLTAATIAPTSRVHQHLLAQHEAA